MLDAALTSVFGTTDSLVASVSTVDFLMCCAAGQASSADAENSAASVTAAVASGDAVETEYASFEDVAADFDESALDLDYSKRDLDASCDASAATAITLEGDSATISGSGATASADGVIIMAAGTYVVTGELTDGQLLVAAGDDDKVQLVLAGATIHNEDGPAMYVQNEDKCFVTLADGAFDYDLAATINGGTVLMVGSTGMAQSFTSGTQAFAMATTSGTAGQTVVVVDASGSVVASFTAPKQFGMVLASSPAFAEGGEYSLVVGGSVEGANADGYADPGTVSGGSETAITASCTASSGLGGLGQSGGPMAAGQSGDVRVQLR